MSVFPYPLLLLRIPLKTGVLGVAFLIAERANHWTKSLPIITPRILIKILIINLVRILVLILIALSSGQLRLHISYISQGQIKFNNHAINRTIRDKLGQYFLVFKHKVRL